MTPAAAAAAAVDRDMLLPPDPPRFGPAMRRLLLRTSADLAGIVAVSAILTPSADSALVKAAGSRR